MISLLPGDLPTGAPAPAQCPVNPRIALVDMNCVKMMTGRSSEELLADVDEGRWRWVFNVAAKRDGRNRTLRFLWREISAPDGFKKVSVNEVTKLILGERKRIRAVEVGALLLVDDHTVHRLHQAGEFTGAIEGRTLWIDRTSLEEFLKRRVQC